VTYSALGQLATPQAKYDWDPDYTKKRKPRDRAAELLPDFEVRAAGTISIDVTHIGIDKAYGMRKLIQALDITPEDILFFCDKLQEGGMTIPSNRSVSTLSKSRVGKTRPWLSKPSSRSSNNRNTYSRLTATPQTI
jgi:hypothetical protein